MEFQQAAFVLHSRPYKETSAIVTFFTEQHGKINGVVRGVRGGGKTSSQKAAAIQPFQKLIIHWREKQTQTSDLVSIRHFEALPMTFPLQSDANICGLYINELLYRLLFPHVAVERLFTHYQQALLGLLKATHDRALQAWTLRQFELKLLDELGQPVMTNIDAQGATIQTQLTYRYYVQLGPTVEHTHQIGNALSHEVVSESSGVLITGQALLALQENQFCQACLPELKALFRLLLADLLGHKPIKTRELFR